MLDLYYRVEELLKELASLDNILVVTHRGVINMVYFLMEIDYLI
jgi:broad specificity phosphatase PhoE